MIRTSLTLSLLVLTLFVSAQVRLAAFAGPQVTTARYVINDSRQPTGHKLGLMAGLGLKVPFENRLYFFPSIYYSLKGYRVTLNDRSYPPTEAALNNDVTLHTVEIAPLFQVDLSSKPSHPFVRFGPAIDIALSGTERFDTLDHLANTGSVTRSMKFGFTAYGRFTASGNFHLGYESEKGWMFFAWYALGFGSLNNADNGPRILHRIGGLSLGWNLREIKGKYH